MFWAAVMELAPSQIRALLRAIVPNSTPDTALDKILYGSIGVDSSAESAGQTSFHIHIMPPTAVALLSADSSEIVFFPHLGAVSLPRYSNLHTMHEQLLRAVKC